MYYVYFSLFNFGDNFGVGIVIIYVIDEKEGIEKLSDMYLGGFVF